MHSPILREDTVKRIKTRHPTLIGSEQSGVRKISLDLLTPPSSVSSRSTSSASSIETTTRFISVPTQLESSQTFEFLGFDPDRAAKLHTAWQGKRKELEGYCTYSMYAMNYVNVTCEEGQDADDDWSAIMTTAGIRSEVREAIMRPEHDTIRYVQSLAVWLEDIIKTAYDCLVDLNERLLEEMAPPSDPHLRGGQGEDYTIPKTPGGHLALFKSVEFRRAKKCIAEDGTINLVPLVFTSPTDLARPGGLYFTHQLWVAKHYSKLIHDACPVADRRTVEIHVPLSHYVSMKTWELGFNDEFKQLLYHSRREEPYPKALSKKRASYGIIKAPIGHAHNRAFAKMEHWSDITEKHQLQEVEDGVVKIGRQDVWIKEDAIIQLAEDCFAKAYLRRPEQGFHIIPKPWEDIPGKVEDAI
jgi:hypothetical protein